jgi:hypothetical protein
MKFKKVIFVTIFLFTLFVSTDKIAMAEHQCASLIVVKNPSGVHHFGIKTKTWSDGESLTIVPRALAIDSKDNIYVGDSVNYRLLKFDSAGRFLSEIKLQPPPQDEAKPEVSHIIHDIGLDDEDNVYVWNYFAGRTEVYDQNGKFIKFIKPNEQANVFTKTSKGRFRTYMYEIESYQKKPAGLLFSITVSDVSSKTKEVISKCNGVDLSADEDGEIYAYDYKGNIYTFDGYSNVIKINPFK